jgi:pSer/pThr/pTyr-binding forkhead associated (FHA) protein
VRLRFRIRPPVTARAAAIERVVDVDSGRPSLILGREAGADIPLPFNTVSARHARLSRAGDGWSLADVGSANGTFLDERRLRVGEPRPLRPGQAFRLADVELVFEGPAEASGPSPVAPESTATLARRLVNDLFGSCRPAEVARVVVVGGPDDGRALVLAEVGRAYQVGRAAGCDLVLADDDVSREHAAFERRWDGVEVRDLGSKNGVEVDGERIAEVARLRDGQVVLVGGTRLRLEDPEDRYLRQMQEEAERAGTTFVPADEAPPERAAPRRPLGPGPVAVAAVALAVLASIGGLVLWLLVGG